MVISDSATRTLSDRILLYFHPLYAPSHANVSLPGVGLRPRYANNQTTCNILELRM
ncbi:hypothetical protein [Moorena sp. SIO4A5]|uniref:hypothetical protein n=1 Tax=Moorena sp. SIO4A5 TaxID=2607838 RepID=UPI0013C5FDDC|nr:hypothetical protein [Moorena sp. SIO4A5]NEO22825.1 hypothetical protein [Moorena sp. SIO4A5]